MISRRWWLRRGASAYLALFFLVVAAAPHHHLNDLEDLLLDQRSDSGVLAQSVGSAGRAEAPALNPVRIVDDVPCLACFTRDFVCGATISFQFVPRLTPLLLSPALLGAAIPELVPAETSSRSPPSLS